MYAQLFIQNQLLSQGEKLMVLLFYFSMDEETERRSEK
jgi:hypothetical protein